MPERISPMAGLLPATLCDGGVTVTEITPQTLAEAQTWDGQGAAALEALATWAGQSPAPGQIAGTAAQGFAQIGPAKVLLWGEDLPVIDPAHGTQVDLSHARVVLAIRGPLARDLLTRALPLDLRDSRFGTGRMAATPFHHIPVLLARWSEDVWSLTLPRSYAQGLYNHLTHLAEILAEA